MIAVSTAPTAMYGKTVFGKLHTKFQNISQFSLRGHFKNEFCLFYTLAVSSLQRKSKNIHKQLPVFIFAKCT